MEKLEQLKEQLRIVNYYRHARELMYWDMATIAPDNAKDKLSDGITFFSTEMFKKTTSDEFYNLILALNEPEEFAKLDDVMQFEVKKYKRDLEKMRRCPAEYFEEYMNITNETTVLWPKAKQTNDWKLYEKPLANTIEAVKKYQSYINPDKATYDALIDQFEEGMTQETIDRVFGELKEELVPLVNKIVNQPKEDMSKFNVHIPKHEQEALCLYLLKYMGMDMDSFCQAESEHPFTTSMSINDARITNHYHEDDIISAIFSAIHEGGHALFEQSIDKKYMDTEASHVDYMGLHESQSRMFENILGRNINFWKPIWKDVIEIVPELKDVTLEEFYKRINLVENSFIRTEADELTYCLHIILRYEIERAIFIEGVNIEDLPALWNKKTEELLHIIPATDAMGILQDTHWSDGGFGYFPSYLLGSIYDGMFLDKIEEQLGSVDEILAAGELTKITDWLRENIHQYGSTRISSEVLEAVCGKELTAQPLIKYFKNKYSKIYNL